MYTRTVESRRRTNPLSTLAALAVLAGLLVAMLSFEVVRYSEARARVRQELAHE